MIEATKVPVGTINLSRLFEPDILSAHQFLTLSRPTRRFEPEARLMFAVLSDAVECFQRYRGAGNPTQRKLSNDAETWIRSEDAKWPYSFERICESLNIDASYLRAGLMRWRATYESEGIPRKRLRPPLRYQYRVRRRRICV
jgi:hypothetical protein